MPRRDTIRDPAVGGPSSSAQTSPPCPSSASTPLPVLVRAVVRGRHRRGLEIEHTDSPVVAPSMRSAIENLRLDQLDVVHVGDRTFPLAEGIRAVAMSRTGRGNEV